MNILIITQMFWPESFRINDVASALASRGHQVTVLTGLPNYPGGRIFPGYGRLSLWTQEHEGARILRVPIAPRGRGGPLRLLVNYASYAFFASVLGPFRARGRYDVILVFEVSPVTVGIPAIVMRWLRTLPIAFWVQDLWPESLHATGAIRSPHILGWVARLVRFIYERCSTILVQSQAFRSSIESLGVPADKIEYVPNSAESFYRPIPRNECLEEDAELPAGFRITFAGNLGVAQDLATLIGAAEATREYTDLHWIVIGDGRQREWLEQEVLQRGLSRTIHLLGSRPAERMPRYFAASHALLVTLRRDAIFSLTIPSKLQSYLACGRPVLAGLDGEGARVVEEANAGLTCPSQSPEKLADAALRLRAATSEELLRMGQSARKYFEANFERDRVMDRLEACLVRASGGMRG